MYMWRGPQVHFRLDNLSSDLARPSLLVVCQNAGFLLFALRFTQLPSTPCTHHTHLPWSSALWGRVSLRTVQATLRSSSPTNIISANIEMYPVHRISLNLEPTEYCRISHSARHVPFPGFTLAGHDSTPHHRLPSVTTAAAAIPHSSFANELSGV